MARDSLCTSGGGVGDGWFAGGMLADQIGFEGGEVGGECGWAGWVHRELLARRGRASAGEDRAKQNVAELTQSLIV